MHPRLQSLGRDLEGLVREFGVHTCPLPDHLSPAELLPALQQLADHHGSSDLIWKTPQELGAAAHSVNALTAPVSSSSDSDELEALVAAVQATSSAPGSRPCHFCQRDGHFLTACPSFKRLLDDNSRPRAISIVRELLRALLGDRSSRPPPRPPPRPRPPAVRQIEASLDTSDPGDGAEAPLDEIAANADSPPDADPTARPDFG